MNLLLDTHVLITTLSNPEELREQWSKAIIDPANTIWVSAISIWEIAIKSSIGKLTKPDGWAQGIADQRFQALPFEARHASAVGALPLHHRDPFDRALIAQAIVEKFWLMTSDSEMEAYRPEVQLLT